MTMVRAQVHRMAEAGGGIFYAAFDLVSGSPNHHLKVDVSGQSLASPPAPDCTACHAAGGGGAGYIKVLARNATGLSPIMVARGGAGQSSVGGSSLEGGGGGGGGAFVFRYCSGAHIAPDLEKGDGGGGTMPGSDGSASAAQFNEQIAAGDLYCPP